MTKLNKQLEINYAVLQAKAKSKATREALIHRLQRLLIPHLPKPCEAAIDLGAGQGELTEALERLGITKVYGIEQSPSQVRLAQEHGCNLLCLGDGGQELQKIGDSSLDLVCCFDVFEHLPHQTCADWFNEIERVLRPGGRLIGHVPNGLSPFSGAVYWGDLTHLWCPVPESMQVFCRASGLQWIGAYENIGASTGTKGKLRSIAWRGVRAILAAASTVETGRNAWSSPWSRTFLFVAERQHF